MCKSKLFIRELCNFAMYVIQMTSRMITNNVLANKTLSKYKVNRKHIRSQEIEDYGCLNPGFACHITKNINSDTPSNFFWLSTFLDLLVVEIIERGVRESPFDSVLQVHVSQEPSQRYPIQAVIKKIW